MEKGKRKFDITILPTILLIIILGVCFWAGAWKVDDIATEACFDTMEDVSAQFVADIKRNVESERKQLEVIADILSEHGDISSAEAKLHMSSIQQRGMVSSITVLLPGDTVIFFKDGEYRDMESILKFEHEAARGAYIAGPLVSTLDETEKFIYQAVPIESEGEVKGILYGFVNLKLLSEYYTTEAFGGTAELYIVDGVTGDYVLDTWHGELGNFYDDYIGIGDTPEDEDAARWVEDLRNGKKSSLVFRSEPGGEYFYAYSRPTGINRWMAQVTAPESVIFEKAMHIRHVLYWLFAMDMVLLLAYLIWVVFRVRKGMKEREAQLQQTLYMYNVQKTLFDVHKHPEHLSEALCTAGRMLTAEFTFLCSLDRMRIVDFYRWADESAGRNELYKEEELQKVLLSVSGKLLRGENIIRNLNGKNTQTTMYGMKNLMIVPIQDLTGNLIGVLGAMNMKQRRTDSILLESVARNFIMALNNMQSYRIIQRMGTVDAITGLKNRNSYEQSLRNYMVEEDEKICCIYMDANGLHELNNVLGHAAGDAMLRFIGETIIGQFGSENAYRIGGDEFVIFCRDISEEEVRTKINRIEEILKRKDYHISTGTAWYDGMVKLEDMILEAEERMYTAKQKYYEEKGDIDKMRKMNDKLEEILLQKKDADTFLSIISAYFLGVHVVNLNTDTSRIIYESVHLEEMMKKTNNRFSEALHLYADIYVDARDRERFCGFIDFKQLKEGLQKSEIPTLHYCRPDGKKLVLRIYKAEDYTEEKQETFWLFEEDKQNS